MELIRTKLNSVVRFSVDLRGKFDPVPTSWVCNQKAGALGVLTFVLFLTLKEMLSVFHYSLWISGEGLPDEDIIILGGKLLYVTFLSKALVMMRYRISSNAFLYLLR